MNHAIVIRQQGGPEVLRFEEVAEPADPGAGELLVRQTAIGVNFLDVYFRDGSFQAPHLPFVDGFEGAGVVEAVGPGASGFSPGDRVCYIMAMGAYAERRLVPSARAVKVPDGIGDAEAAAMMLKGCTAEYLLRRALPVHAGACR